MLKRLAIIALLTSCVAISGKSAPADTLQTRVGAEKLWANLIPRIATLQFAGNMGFASLGAGWKYGKREQLESTVLVGFVPKYDSDKAKMTLTFKQNYVPIHIEPCEKVHWDPITLGVYMNMITGDDFWTKLPDRYPRTPSKFYLFPTRWHFNICMGQRVEFNLWGKEKQERRRSIGLFYEFSANERYLIEAFMNPKYMKFKDYAALSIGVTLRMF